jgi:hypothetical protein
LRDRYLPIAINALQNARSPTAATFKSQQRAGFPPVGSSQGGAQGYDIDHQNQGTSTNQAAPSATLRQAVSSIYASSLAHPSTSDNTDLHHRGGSLHPDVNGGPMSGVTSRSISDQEVPTRGSGSSRSSWGVASGYDEIRREEADDAGISGNARPGSTRRTSSWFRWSAAAAAQDLKDKTE